MGRAQRATDTDRNDQQIEVAGPKNRGQIFYLTREASLTFPLPLCIGYRMRSERDRTRLIAELASILRECSMPDDARSAGLTLIGWLARRMPGEAASTDGVDCARRQLDACFQGNGVQHAHPENSNARRFRRSVAVTATKVKRIA